MVNLIYLPKMIDNAIDSQCGFNMSNITTEFSKIQNKRDTSSFKRITGAFTLRMFLLC